MAKESANDVVLSYHDSLLRKSDVHLLEGPFWLNDIIIGFYFEYLDRQCQENPRNRLLYIGPEMTQLLKMNDPSQYNTFLDPIIRLNHSFIFFPLNNCDSKESAGGSHWSLLVYSRIDDTCYHFDSSKYLNQSVAMDFAKNITFFFTGSRQETFIETDCPQQNNSYDCGLFVLCLTDIISKHILDTFEVNECNFEVVTEMIRGKRTQLLNLICTLKKRQH